jgi:hypothetical protein
LEETSRLKEAELQRGRNEQYEVLHKNKQDQIRIQEQLNMQIQALNKEKSSLEGQVRSLLIEKDQWLESIA